MINIHINNQYKYMSYKPEVDNHLVTMATKFISK